MSDTPASVVICMECQRPLSPEEPQHALAQGSLCAACFQGLQAMLRDIGQSQSQDIPYPLAIAGGALGGLGGAAVWWGFTYFTGVQLGLVALVIGVATGQGVLRMSGHKRAVPLQAISAGIALLSYIGASWAVLVSLINRELAAEGSALLPLIVPPHLAVELMVSNFQAFDLIFLAIVLYEAWRIPKPMRLA